MGRPERWVACSDLHGDMQDRRTVAAFHAFVKDYKPAVRICMGDVFDLRWLRRSAGDDEKLEEVTADFQNGCEFLRKFKPTVLLWGNHDQRLRDALDSRAAQGALRAMAEQWIGHIEDITPGCRHYPYDKRQGVHRYGDHAFIHGYSHGVGALRKAVLTYGNVLMGHVHRSDSATVERHEQTRGYSVGCLCKLDMGYNRAALGTLAQSHGWAYGIKDKNGKLVVQNVQEVGGRLVCPTDFKVYG